MPRDVLHVLKQLNSHKDCSFHVCFCTSVECLAELREWDVLISFLLMADERTHIQHSQSIHSNESTQARGQTAFKLILSFYCYTFRKACKQMCEFPVPEPSCHLSFSAKSQERNESFPCSSLLSLTICYLCFRASSEQLPVLYLSPLCTQ